MVIFLIESKNLNELSINQHRKLKNWSLTRSRSFFGQKIEKKFFHKKMKKEENKMVVFNLKFDKN